MQDVKRFKSSNLPSTHSKNRKEDGEDFFFRQSVEIFIEQKRRKMCLHQQWHKWEKEEGRTRYNRFIWKLSILYSNQIFFFLHFFPPHNNFILSQFFFPFFLFCVRWYGCVLCIVYWWIHSISKQTLFNILLHILACAFIIIAIREEKIHSRREIIRRVENKCMGCFRLKHFLTSKRLWNL